jgi:hypothetical protein
MHIKEKLNTAIDANKKKLHFINICIDEEMSLPQPKRKMLYLIFLAKERSIYEFAINELEKIGNES